MGRHQWFVAGRRTAGAVLVPYVTDGCSGGLSAGWAFAARALPGLAEQHGENPPWESCCVTHDRAYHSGGSPDGDADASFAARRAADVEMWQCVIGVGETRAASLMDEYGLSRDAVALLYRGIGDAMYRAVRLGGAPCSPLPWRWGFGWPRC
ncbi:MAG: hypothetical protein GY798_33070 [Hyphomicrobiales bacterium]|nr:hypothetical protein [Hyphomicrobiales bacterium]